ncbi:MAG: hypothetical protein RLY16_121 [Bacteroidota bacterium]|jgi:hypothetical protein
MKISVFLFGFFLIMFFAKAQSPMEQLAIIPDSIKKEVAAVVMKDDLVVTIVGLEKTTIQVHQESVILNEKAKHLLSFQHLTSKYILLDDFEIRFVDANGKLIQRVKKKDLQQTAAGGELVEDDVLNYYEFVPTSYPISAIVDYTINIKGSFIIPAFRPDNNFAYVHTASYTLKTPLDFGIRYHSVSDQYQPIISNEEKEKIYRWQVSALKQAKYEVGAVPFYKRKPLVQLAPNQFSHYGYEGDLSSWKNFGQWLNQLYAGLDVLPEDQQATILKLVANETSTVQKTKKIYDYLQQNFRYVSIQLGIGGLRPFSASFTGQKKYGDCKALSNYMHAALKVAGIRSHIAIINSGFNSLPVEASFPHNGFDHVILCVPQSKDSIWLECTSNIAGFNELGTFTENRKALLLTEEGGQLVNTPASKYTNNQLQIKTIIRFAEDWSTDVNFQVVPKGEFIADVHYSLREVNANEQKENLLRFLGIQPPNEWELSKDALARHVLNGRVWYAKYADMVTPTKVFLKAVPDRLFESNPFPKPDERAHDFYLKRPFEINDTTCIELPEGFEPDKLPSTKQTNCSNAYFAMEFQYMADKKLIQIIRNYRIYNHRVDKSQYADFYRFVSESLEIDQQKIVIKKKG